MFVAIAHISEPCVSTVIPVVLYNFVLCLVRFLKAVPVVLHAASLKA